MNGWVENEDLIRHKNEDPPSKSRITESLETGISALVCKKKHDLPIISEIDKDLRFLHTPPPPPPLMQKTKPPLKTTWKLLKTAHNDC